VPQRADAGPVPEIARDVAGPGVEGDPGGLLGEEVGVAGEGPEAGSAEAAVEV
ncbi:MAG: hypothetical protein Q9194_006404, partial [Teloschistes cf. exilis]